MKKLEIEVLNNYGKVEVDLKYLDKLEAVFQEYLKSEKNTLDLTIVDDKTIQKLNKEHRNKDAVTDVLSFANAEVKEDFPKLSDTVFLGEILISYPQIKRQSEENNIDLEKEFYLMIIHGLLHLLGYDHIKDDEANIMEALEDELLLELFKD